MALPYTCIWIFVISAFLLWLRTTRNSRRRVSLPPGPPSSPIVGHLWSVPSTHQDHIFYKWGKMYGDVIHLHIPGKSWIVLNSVKAATDLLDKRSHNYSDRPTFRVYELMGWQASLTFLRYGRQFQLHRRIYQQYLNRKQCIDYRPIQAREAHVLLQNLISNPEDYRLLLGRFSAAIITRCTFGHQVTSDDDVYIKMADDMGHAVAAAGSPGGTMVDLFPFLRYFPSWFPGTHYASVAWRYKPAVQQFYEYPVKEVRKQMAKGHAKPSFLSLYLEALDRDGANSQNTIADIQGAAATIYTAGAETTSSSLSILLLAMVLNPECQTRAQEEIDKVISLGRLPEFADRESLPYVECVMQESLRWNHAVPLGVPHRSIEDDIYNGMLIPKGSIVIANTRGISLDENVYSNPLVFDPTRYLPKPIGKGEPHPVAHFGFGRRVCPGRHLADSSLWIAIASILATLRISKAVGKDGKEITPKVQFASGIVSHPLPFLCKIEPRNEAARSLITQADISDNY